MNAGKITIIFLSFLFLLLFTPYANSQDCGCDACHGNPPITDNKFGWPDGLVGSPKTGAASAGAHAKHVTNATGPLMNDICYKCHVGGMPFSPVCGNYMIQLGLGGGTYDGQVLSAPYSYEGKNSTTITTGGTKKCLNIYCHSNGTSIPTQVMQASSSPAWDSRDSATCVLCHNYPPSYLQDQPKSNSHNRHASFTTCSTCHFTTTSDGASITDKTKHINQRYDVIADPNAIYSGGSVTFSYAYDPGGGICNNISCHIAIGWPPYKPWGGVLISINSAWKSGTNCYEEIFYNVSAYNGTAPYSYFWDFGDGTTSTEQNPTHVFPSGSTYAVTLTARDANRHPGAKTTTVTPHSANISPVANATASVYGWTVTLTDLSYDLDYNSCGHAGPGSIDITWNGPSVRTTEAIDLTGMPSNKAYTYTYPSSSSKITYYIFDYITDNSNTKATKSIPVTIPSTYKVSGRITNSSGVGMANIFVYLRTTSGAVPSYGTTYAYTNANGYYTFSDAAVEGTCYIVKQPVKSGYTFTPGDQTVCAANTEVNFTSSP